MIYYNSFNQDVVLIFTISIKKKKHNYLIKTFITHTYIIFSNKTRVLHIFYITYNYLERNTF